MRTQPSLFHTTSTCELQPATDLHPLPTRWALHDLLPCHRLTCFLAPSGTGLSSLAYRLLAHYIPAPNYLDPLGGSAASPRGSGASPDLCLERLAPGLTTPASPAPASIPSSSLPSPFGRGAGGEGAVPGTPPSPCTDTVTGPSAASGYGLINNHYPSDPPSSSDTPDASSSPSLPLALLITFRDDPDVLRPRLAAAGIDTRQLLILSHMHAPDPG